MSKIHLGLIGLGQIAIHHLAGIQANPQLQLDAVFDLDSKKYADLQTSLPKGVVTCDSVSQLLSLSITHVIICTPPDSHAHYVELVLNAGMIPLVEKPIVGAHENLPSSDKSVHTIYHWCFAPEVQTVKHLLEKQTVRYIHIHIQDPYLDAQNKHIQTQYDSKVDPWSDSGINALSMVAYLLGDERMDSVTNFRLRHSRHLNGVPVRSVARMWVNNVFVKISVSWSNSERKKSTIITNKKIYHVNHCQQTVKSSILRKKHPVELPDHDRLNCHYINFYRVFDWSNQNGNMPLTTSLHTLFTRQGYTRYHAWIERRFNHWLQNSNKRVERMPYYLSLLVLVVFFWYIYGSCLNHISAPSWLSSPKHAFRLTDFIVNVLASLVGIVSSYLFYNFAMRIKRIYEDAFKVTYSDRELRLQYGSNYLQHGEINHTRFSVYYEPFFHPTKQPAKVVVKDSLEKFELDNFIRFQYFSIREAHADDSFQNEPTIRLRHEEWDDQTKTLTLYTQRSNYLAHMLTNRAIDYRINGMASMRKLFEYQSTLTPLQDSKFANHIGINALILIDDDQYVLLPQRSSHATISKRMFTASVATRLKPKDNDYSHLLTPSDTVLNDLSESVILSAMAINEREWGTNRKIETTFIGAGRDIYEGGKPTLFYLVRIPDLKLQEYLDMDYHRRTHFDEIKRIFVIPWKSLSVRNNCICTRGVPVSHIKSVNTLTSYFYRGRLRGYVLPEKNLLSLLWTYSQIPHIQNKTQSVQSTKTK